MQPLLKMLDVQVQYVELQGKKTHALNGVTLEVSPGHVVGLLGESGSGKSTLARALLRLLPPSARITGRIEFEGQDLLALDEGELQKTRGSRIAMIPQEPGLALNPVMRVGDQIAEVMRAHRDWNSKERRERTEALLSLVHLQSAERRVYDAYPHQLSGGQQQRVAIAQALACEPALVVADEPTASLDSATENEILRLLRELKAERRMSLLLITHDPMILTGLADRVAVMYAGRIVEEGSLESVSRDPLHPYSRALLACVPPEPGERTGGSGRWLPTIEGGAPDTDEVACGCAFAPRCTGRRAECTARKPVVVETADAHRVECVLHGG